jgi:hypothetical protein
MMHTCSDSAGLGRETAGEAAIKARGEQEAQGADLDADRPLPHLHVGERLLQVDLGGVSTRHHVAVAELHGLGTLRANLALDDHLQHVR